MTDPPARPTAPRRSFRDLGRALEIGDSAVWLLGVRQEIVYLNGATAMWLGVTPDDLLGRRCHVAGEGDSVIDEIAKSLAPPPGMRPGEAVVVSVEPPGKTATAVRFLRIGDGDATRFLAIADGRDDPAVGGGERFTAEIRERLTLWRQPLATRGVMAAAGASYGAACLRQRMQIASTTRYPFSIHGPRGCGGEVVARRIHQRSAGVTAKGTAECDPLIVVDTPLMDNELLDATLSPAASHLGDKPERTVTLLLRGLDESPLEIQDRVLSFVGNVSSRVRMIGLLGVPIDQAQERLTARMRLAMGVLSLEMPPLSERPEDIPLIAAAILDHRHGLGKTVAERIDREALDRLVLYPWPDNYDELEATIRHASTVCRGSTIVADDLPLAVRSYRARAHRGVAAIPEETLDVAMQRFELERIRSALESAAGNRSEAARLLGISRGRLLRRLDESATDEPSDS